MAETPAPQTLHLMVGGIHCAGCVAKLERTLGRHAGVIAARVNLTTKRMALTYNPAQTGPEALQTAAEALGYTVQPYNPELLERADNREEKKLLLCMAVAGFASMNVMLLSVSLWAGVAEMGASTRALMQGFSALIVLPTVAYAGQPFLASAWQALRHGRVNMDVPISLAVLLTSTLSFADMALGRGETYFESAVMLLFFLLVGRYLDSRARGRNRSAAEQLLRLQSETARRLLKNGKTENVPIDALRPGDLILVARGQRVGADGVVEDGTSMLNLAFLTGESLPQRVRVGSTVPAGALNEEAPLRLRVTAAGQNTTLAQLARLVEEATQAKNRYTRLADRVARLYAPVVHTLSLGTFLVWFFIIGAGFHQSLLTAAAVLIVTCPCALALAVPAVQVAVVSKLLRHGVILKVPDALERLTTIKTIVLDKTGTLTTGKLALVGKVPAPTLHAAAGLAAASTHPLSVALAKAAPGVGPYANVKEHPGKGLSAKVGKATLKLGSAAFCGVKQTFPALQEGQSAVFFTSTAPGSKPARFVLADTLKPDAAATVAQLTAMGLAPTLLSGDAPATVTAVGLAAGVAPARIFGGKTPAEKHAFLQAEAHAGRPALMCGDGINDAPSLAAARVGLTFGSASSIAQTSADFILQQENLALLPRLMVWARQAHRAVLLNFGLSFGYNVITVPLAMAGYITPLWAAAAMSASSICVVLNALRLAK